MKVLVVGGGLIGVASAYFLNRAGHEVAVIEREACVGMQTSFANGSLLTPSMADPWNAPGSWRVLLGSLARSDAALQLRPSVLPSLASWGVGFLRNSRTEAFRSNTLKNLRLALHSMNTMAALREETGVQYARAATGSLRVFRSSAALNRVCVSAQHLNSEGIHFRKLSPWEIRALDPALAPICDQLVGGIYYQLDEVGDAHLFCVSLAEVARQRGVRFLFDTAVTQIVVGDGRVTALVAGGQTFTADLYVIAAGSYTGPMLRKLGIRVPVQPAKGYSVTFDLPAGSASLRVPVIDDELHAVVVPVAGAIRAAGTAEFAGYDLTLPDERIANLTKLACAILPEKKLELSAGRTWCGLRPMSVDGVPIIGPAQLPNLWLNTGHGHLGWTMAAGSGELLVDLIAGHAPRLPAVDYSLARFEHS